MADKILVADDSLTIQKVVAITLANEPWVLVEATDESELFGKLRGGNYKLVLFDFNLSESKSGYELAAEIKKIAPTVKSMAMLGTFDSVEESSLASSGVDGKIVKPFDSQKFIAKCRELIDSGEGALSFEEEKSLDFSDENDSIDDSEGWVMDSPQPSEIESEDAQTDNWDEETSPGISIEENPLSSELEGWGVSVPDPIGVSPASPQEIPPIINSSEEKDSELKWEEDEPVQEDEIQFQIGTAETGKDAEDTVYPETDELDYPDLDIAAKGPSSNMISLDQLSIEEDSDLPLTIERDREPEPIREDLAKEIESELSPDDFWAADEEEGEATIELSAEHDDDLDDSRESFVVGVGDPSAPVEPIKPSQKVDIQLETAPSSFNEDQLVEKIKASLAPMLEEIVKQYMNEKIEKVAWEIIPDVAENLIRKEIKELSQASRNS
tara:strand:+ start:6814 stop:8133 length:1320 start_codon:yes stop_codon:yes gene_type:complete